jgi:hypothetical protein
MTGGSTVSFQFAELLVEESGGWMTNRIGRLLPPYLTRLQQRYAAYLQRPGLSRIPKAAWPIPPAVAAVPLVVAVPQQASHSAKKAGGKVSAQKSPKRKKNIR